MLPLSAHKWESPTYQPTLTCVPYLVDANVDLNGKIEIPSWMAVAFSTPGIGMSISTLSG